MQLMFPMSRPKVKTLVGMALLSLVATLLTMALFASPSDQADAVKAAAGKKDAKKAAIPAKPDPPAATSDEPLLQVVPPMQPTEISFVMGEKYSKVFKVSNAATEELSIRELVFNNSMR